MSKQTKVTVETQDVGVNFATIGVLRSVRTGRVLARGEEKPFRFVEAARADAEKIAASRGYQVVEAE